MRDKRPYKILNKLYDVREISSGIYDIDESKLSTMYLIIGSERALVIDCGIGIGDFKSVIEQMTALPYDVVCSHAHVDHIGGRGQFDRIYLHKDDVSIIPDVTTRFRKNYKRSVMRITKRFYKSGLIPVEREPVVIPIEDNHIFNLGDKRVKVIHTTGHTLGSLCFHVVEDNVLLTTDNFNPILFLFLPHTDTVENFIRSTEKVLSIPDVKIYWGSHLRKPNSRQTLENALKNAKEIHSKQINSKRSYIKIRFRHKSFIVYKSDKVRNYTID